MSLHPKGLSAARARVPVADLVWQFLLIVAVMLVIGFAAWNAAQGLARQGIASGFGFLSNTAGFDISQRLVAYSAISTYARAFLVGLLNTLLVSAIAIPLATLLGFLIGIMRQSRNWLLKTMSGGYVEIFRNTPLLLQLLFWYNAVLASLPISGPDSLRIGDAVFLNRRGLSIPEPVFGHNFSFVALTIVVACAASFFLHRWARRRHRETGRPFPATLVSALILMVLPLAALMATAGITGVSPIGFALPQPTRFGVNGGWQLLPEFAALLLGLVIYTSASIAEVVRSGLAAVSRGQYEAAQALHLPTTSMFRLVIVPQAIRIIIPPLTNQHLNLIKNSSLAVAIGYPDLVQVFAGTVLNQTGQAVEIVLMTMAVYLAISVVMSAAMNYYNRRIRLVER